MEEEATTSRDITVPDILSRRFLRKFPSWPLLVSLIYRTCATATSSSVSRSMLALSLIPHTQDQGRLIKLAVVINNSTKERLLSVLLLC